MNDLHDTRRLNADLDRIETEPYYEPVGGEVALFEAAWASRVPVLLKGPTGCGKTRFVEHMAWRLARPLVTVSCHDDLTASDLVGRYLIVDNQTVWVDGPRADLEAKIVVTETGIDASTAGRLVKFAAMTRNLKGSGLDEGASTRLLVHAAQLMQRGVTPRAACAAAISLALSDDAEILAAIDELASAVF